jgi:penicillin-binding protein 1A
MKMRSAFAKRPGSRRQLPPREKFKKWFWWIGLSPLLGFALLTLVALIGPLPDTDALTNPKTDLATRIYAVDGRIIGRYYSENRSDVRFDELPQHLVDALICTEDARFSEHSGIDFRSLARAVMLLGTRGGGSTITQQLAKLLFTEEYESSNFIERALLQKPREWIIASRLERYYTKGEILAMYLNRYDFLNQAVGIRSAANVYFDKDVKDLNVQESAMLVGMLKNSSLYNPMRRPERVMERREVVLNQMERYGKLTEEAYDSLRATPLGLNFQIVSHDEGTAPYFREILRAEVTRLLEEKNEDGSYKIAKADGSPYDLYRDGLNIFTTIDSRMQQSAEAAVKAHLATELQEAFAKDVKRRPKEDYPFFKGIDPKQREANLRRAIKESRRYQFASGAMCPECHRPAHYIEASEEDGEAVWRCNEDAGGCSHTWPKLSEAEIDREFDTPVAMRVFSHSGPLDTVMSPLDSIMYHKAILHAGLIAIEPVTGHIKAWVGGIDYRSFKYDNVGQSRRQVGSVFKPFVYAAALQRGLTRCTELPNQKICIPMGDGYPDWCPDNADFQYGNMVTLEYALANSMNTISAKLIKDYGPDAVIQVARDLGIESEIPRAPSIALGSAELTLKEMTSALAALANEGVYVAPRFIVRIEDKFGNAIYTPDPEIRQGIDPRTAAVVVEMMKGVVDGAVNLENGRRGGTGMRLRGDWAERGYDGIRIPLAGKTGTTQNHTDGWFIGLTPALATGVWVGAQDPAVRFSSIHLGQGANTALPIFGYFMRGVLDNDAIDFPRNDFRYSVSLGADSVDCRRLVRAIEEEEIIVDDEELFE